MKKVVILLILIFNIISGYSQNKIMFKDYHFIGKVTDFKEYLIKDSFKHRYGNVYKGIIMGRPAILEVFGDIFVDDVVIEVEDFYRNSKDFFIFYISMKCNKHYNNNSNKYHWELDDGYITLECTPFFISIYDGYYCKYSIKLHSNYHLIDIFK